MLSGCIIDCFVDFVVFKTRYELKKNLTFLEFNVLSYFIIHCTLLIKDTEINKKKKNSAMSKK